LEVRRRSQRRQGLPDRSKTGRTFLSLPFHPILSRSRIHAAPSFL
jgi:hypothetical protein